MRERAPQSIIALLPITDGSALVSFFVETGQLGIAAMGRLPCHPARL